MLHAARSAEPTLTIPVTPVLRFFSFAFTPTFYLRPFADLNITTVTSVSFQEREVLLERNSCVHMFSCYCHAPSATMRIFNDGPLPLKVPRCFSRRRGDMEKRP